MSEAAEVAQTGTQADNNFSIPEEYSDRGWTKTVQSYDDLFKAFDNSQSLLGKRPAGIPEKDASPEEWDKFYKTLGRPETPDAYELTEEFDGLPEGTDLNKYKSQAAELAHKIGLSPKQANDLWDNYMQIELAAHAESQEAQAAKEKELDAEFDKLGNSLFGDSFDDVSKQAQAYLNDILPDELKGVTESLGDNPKALLTMIKLAHSTQEQIAQVKREYGAEDQLKSGEQSGGESVHEINAKLVDAKARYNKADVFSPDRKAIQEEINALRERLRKAV